MIKSKSHDACGVHFPGWRRDTGAVAGGGLPLRSKREPVANRRRDGVLANPVSRMGAGRVLAAVK